VSANHHLSIVSGNGDPELGQIAAAIEGSIIVNGRADLESQLCRLLTEANPLEAKTLDLIGHSTSASSLLVLGDWVIDATSTKVTSFFRELAEQDVLRRLGVCAVRLLGCLTADSAHGKWTIVRLAELLGVEVYGVTGLLLASHYDRHGFSDDRRYLLASASELLKGGVIPRPLDRRTPNAFVLDIDALDAVAMRCAAWPVRPVSVEQARELLALVRRRDGSVLPGLLVSPELEIALPAVEPGKFHMLQVLLDGGLIRVFPRGEPHGVVYAVDDPYTFRKLLGHIAPLTAEHTASRA